MARSAFTQARVTGIVTTVPPDERRIDDEVELFGGNLKSVERLKKTIGLDRRRVVDEVTTAADLCAEAARHLLAKRGMDAAALDALVFVTQTPDYPQPCNAALLHGWLGCAHACAALDVNLGCSGYVYGLWLAHMMIESGGCGRVLVLAGDTVSRLAHPRDRAVAALFGDGGSATLVERDTGTRKSWFCLETDGRGYDRLIVPAGGARRPKSASTAEVAEDEGGNLRSAENLFMDGAEIFNFSITVEPRAVRELAAFAGLPLDAVDYFVFHQANRYILGNIAKRLKVDPAKVPMRTVERFGNQSSASIPSALCGELGETLGEPQPRTLLLSGFGVGLSWGSCILEGEGLFAAAIYEYGSTGEPLSRRLS